MKTTIALLLLLSCLSCGPTFRSNINPADKTDFHRVLIVSKLSAQHPDYMLDYVNRFPAGYEVCTLELGVLSFNNPDSLIREKQRQCNSEVMLTIQDYANRVTGNGKYTVSYQETLLEMTNLSTNKPFWKAIATTNGGWPGAGAIIRQLRTDGIINGKTRQYEVVNRTAQY